MALTEQGINLIKHVIDLLLYYTLESYFVNIYDNDSNNCSHSTIHVTVALYML